MRILNRKEFLALDRQVVFAKYEPMTCGELCIKLENCGSDDFVTQSLSPESAIENNGTDEWIEKLSRAESDHGVELATDFDYAGRDGVFDQDQLFAVYSQDDVRALIARLQETLR